MDWFSKGCSAMAELPSGETVEVATIKGFECIFQNVLNIVVRLAGIAVLIFIIIGGFQYLTAGGDPKKSESAKNTITYAILGLVLLILAWFILKFIQTFTGIKNCTE